MGIKELREIYGPKSKAPAVIARAVCAECPGGARLYEIRDALRVAKVASPELEPLYAAATEALQEMKTAIAKRYDLKTSENYVAK
ncbi:MAG: hypothetical protein IKY61_01110 [Thermoguttaceae bacterium]|nr:hypothetical protein [Thermoguttaceae bacterium]